MGGGRTIEKYNTNITQQYFYTGQLTIALQRVQMNFIILFDLFYAEGGPLFGGGLRHVPTLPIG